MNSKEKVNGRQAAKPVKLCMRCKDANCKENNYPKMKSCKSAFRWKIFGLSALTLFFVLLAVFFIIRLVDNNWHSIELPVTLLTIYIVLVTGTALIISFINMKGEIKRN